MRYYVATVGMVCALIGIVMLGRRMRLYCFGVRVRARLVRWEMRGLAEPCYHPVVSFVAHDGKVYEVTSLSGYDEPTEKTSEFTVIHPYSAPAKGFVYSFVAYWLAPFVFLLFACACWFIVHDAP